MGCSSSKKKENGSSITHKPIQGSIYNIFRLLSQKESPRAREHSNPLDIDEYLKEVVDVCYEDEIKITESLQLWEGFSE